MANLARLIVLFGQSLCAITIWLVILSPVFIGLVVFSPIWGATYLKHRYFGRRG